MKKYFVLFVALILLAFCLVGCGSDENAEAVAELQATVDDLQNQVQEYTALESELESANNSIADLQSEIDALKAEKDEMTAKLELLYKIEPLDATMYTTADAKVYDDLYGEILGYEPVATIPEGTEVKITGKSVVTNWYVLKTEDGSIQMVNNQLVSTTKPVQQSSNNNGSTGNAGNGNGSGNPPAQTQQPPAQTQQPPTDDEWDPGSLGFGESVGPSGDWGNFEVQ